MLMLHYIQYLQRARQLSVEMSHDAHDLIKAFFLAARKMAHYRVYNSSDTKTWPYY
jgi:hypothetical protein